MSDLNDINKICELYKIKDYTINSDGSIDVDSDVRLFNSYLTELPLIFNEVYGSFHCGSNQLTSLKGCPKLVTNNFYCNDNLLTNLEHAPIKVGGVFDCSENKLTSLKGCPDKTKDFYCSDNNLKNLNGAPNEINGDFYCEANFLTTLKYSPQNITGDFKVSFNDLTNLENVPNCSNLYLDNNKITSLKSNKAKIKENIYLMDNNIKDISGFELDFGGVIYSNKGDYNILISGKELGWINSLLSWKMIDFNKKEINKKKFDYLLSLYKSSVEDDDIDYADPDNHDLLPKHIQVIIDNYLDDSISYDKMDELSRILKINGWYMDYGLDGDIVELKPSENQNFLYDKLKEKEFKFV